MDMDFGFFLLLQWKQVLKSNLSQILVEVHPGILCVHAGTSNGRYYGVRCGFRRVLQVPGPRAGEGLTSNHEVISVNRPLYSSTVVGSVTTFGIGGRKDVEGGARSSLLCHDDQLWSKV